MQTGSFDVQIKLQIMVHVSGLPKLKREATPEDTMLVDHNSDVCNKLLLVNGNCNGDLSGSCPVVNKRLAKLKCDEYSGSLPAVNKKGTELKDGDLSGSCLEVNKKLATLKLDESWPIASSCPLLWTAPGTRQHEAATPHEDANHLERWGGGEKKSVRAKARTSFKRWWSDLEPGSAWAALFFAILPLNIICGIDYVSFSVYYVAYAEHFTEESRYSIGVIVAIRESVSCAFGLITSVLIRKYGCITTAIASGVVLSVGLILSSFAPNIHMLYITQGTFSGIAYSLNFITGNYMLQKNFSTNRGLGSGIGMLGYTIGQFSGVLVIDALIEQYGWRGCLLLHAGISAHTVVLSMLASAIRPELMARSPTAEKCPDTKDSKSSMCHELSSFLKDVFDFSLFKELRFVLVCLGTMMFRWNKITYHQHMPSRAVSLGMTRSDGADLAALASGTACVCRVLVTCISNINCVNRVLLYNSGYAMAAVADYIIVIFESYRGQQVGAIFDGMKVGISNTLMFVMMVDLFGVDKLARSMALTEITFIIVAFAAAPIGGYLYDVTGSYDATFLLAGSLVALGGVLVFTVVILDICRRKREKKHGQSEEGLTVTVEVSSSNNSVTLTGSSATIG